MSFSLAMPWHEGEEKMHQLLHAPTWDNPTSTILTPQASFMLQRSPLLAIGTLDSQERPWTTVWGGSTGFTQPLGNSIIGTRTLVDGQFDPVVEALVGGVEKGEMAQPEGDGKLMAGLTIDLMSRKRIKLAGHVVASVVNDVNVDFEDEAVVEDQDIPHNQTQIQLVSKIDQTLGNCPKYLNQYELQPALVTAKLLSKVPTLTEQAKEVILKSDMFFLSSSTREDMDTNHRGGPQGFVRVLSDNEFVYPEYSGNRLYQSLGNLQVNPRIGVTFPDYETGDVLYTTGTAEILVGADAKQLLPGSNVALKITVEEARLVQTGLPFRGTRKIPSPYNPLVRTLAQEGNTKAAFKGGAGEQTIPTAFLTKKILLTPSIARFTFSVPDGIKYKAGQWAAFDFSEHMDQGYSHMRDSDPQSLNDDFVRTFTISSHPKSADGIEKEFEITIRNVGSVTGFLLRQDSKSAFKVPVLGVGGEFEIEQQKGITPFVTGGVGITPLLGQVASLKVTPETFKLLWTIRPDDIGLVTDTLEQFPDLATSAQLFVTGLDKAKQRSEAEAKLEALEGKGVQIEKRRIAHADLMGVDAQTWYLCAGKPLRKQLLAWLNGEGKKVVFEDFDY